MSAVKNLKRGFRQYLFTGLIAVAAFVAGGVFLDRNLPEVVTEENTERILPEGTYLLYHTEEFADILADPEIETLRIPDGVHAILPEATLHKLLVVESGAMLEVGYLDVETDGQVIVEGTLDIGDTMVRMHGEDVRILVEASGTLIGNENTILWSEADENLSVAVGAEYTGSSEGRHIMLDEEETFLAAQSVSSYEAWKEVSHSGLPVRLDADIVFPEETSFTCPVYVSEGVTISTEGGGLLEVATELFVNHGTIRGQLSVSSGAFFLNCGTVDAKGAYANVGADRKTAIILNLGAMEGDQDTSVGENVWLYNAGTIDAYSLALTDGICFNYGSILAKARAGAADDSKADMEPGENSDDGEASFVLSDEGRLYNYGYFTIETDSIVKNAGRIENAGYFTVENGAGFENNVFYNRGQFACGVTSVLNEQSGIYYGNGEFRINGISSVAVWKTADWKFDADYREVGTAEEFAAALEDNEVEKILVTSPLQIAEDIEITKPVFLKQKLSVADDAVCLLKNTYMVLLAGGRLETKALTLENSLLTAESGNVQLADAILTLENRSAFCADTGEVDLTGCSIETDHKSTFSFSVDQ